MPFTAPSSPFGVCVWPVPSQNLARAVEYPQYAREVLAHAGVCHADIAPEDLGEALPALRVLLTVGEGRPDQALASSLDAWVRGGGAWISVGSACGLDAAFGVAPEEPAFASWAGGAVTLGEGYLEPASGHPAVAGLPLPLHYFNGAAVRAVGAEVLARCLDPRGGRTGRAAITLLRDGAGWRMLIAPDLTGAIVRIQQGIAVTRDGTPAPDGTAPTTDGVLKSDDGIVLDWDLDRRPVPGIPGMRAFLEPVADLWREVLLRAVLHAARDRDLCLPLLWFYPRGLPALAHLSHDTDLNHPARALELLEVLAEAGVRATWCVILPGYPAEVIAAIGARGHELAMHFDAMSDGALWSEDAFHEQHRLLTEAFSGARPVSNKNHYLRWEGDADAWEWCVRRGILLDQSKGASKTGAAGYGFGACHPYRPVTPDGRVLDVLEMVTCTQDMEVFVPRAFSAALTETVLRHHGVLHMLYHPAHIDKPGVADSLRECAADARARGMEWWTAREIAEWERARRAAAWESHAAAPGEASAVLRAGEAMPGATVLWLAPEGARMEVDGVPCAVEEVERWGLRFASVTLDAPAGSATRLSARWVAPPEAAAPPPDDATPAIAGGAPAMAGPYGRETRYGEPELRQLREALEQGTLFYAQGRKVRALEEAFANRLGLGHAVACSSGTAAIHAALIALGVSPGDEVITSPITDMGSVIPILFQGAVPVFADVDPRTANLDPAAVERAITPRTRAVVAVHLAGNACDLDALSALCSARGVPLVEDCAQALGCTYRGRPAGTRGAVGCFSLNEFKHISCGDGGLVVTDDADLAVRLQLAVDKCYDRRPGVAVRSPTFLAANYRMTELQGAVALAQLSRLDDIVARRRAWCSALTTALAGTPGLLLPEPTAGCDPSWWFYLMRVDPERLGADADGLAAALRAEGLPTGAHYIGQCVYEYPLFVNHTAFARGAHPFAARPYGAGLCPSAEEVLRTCVLLSVNEGYTREDLEGTARGIRRSAAWLAARRSDPARA